MSDSTPVQTQIQQLVTNNPVVLFMKGTRQMPQCGFSSQVVQILNQLVPSYETVDVLSSPELRAGIKEYSQWPTIPQVYVGGEFIGGCDIVREMHANGELQKLLSTVIAEPAVPTLTFSVTATAALSRAMADAGGDSLRLKIDSDFQHDLYFGQREPGDLEVTASGLTLLVDRLTARRAEGLKVDFIEGAEGGFKLTNPNAPAKASN